MHDMELHLILSSCHMDVIMKTEEVYLLIIVDIIIRCIE